MYLILLKLKRRILRKFIVVLFKQILNESKYKSKEFLKFHVKDEYDMNSIFSLLELQKEKQTSNKEILNQFNQITIESNIYNYSNKQLSSKKSLEQQKDLNILRDKDYEYRNIMIKQI
ncbi:unnamed protein product [Paramecium sonneborni]|uniref:Uncharacterized protein n=1 Tax=Paramecium sonneborni TaxID=65129 RepID=A0A8S1QEK1_9CILI|nr:unnamed protein product [Paramecium sonneborni]